MLRGWVIVGPEAAGFAALTIGNALHNLVVSTVGNLLGGSLMVGAVYWFIYLRGRGAVPRRPDAT